jgi:hypothetical protein
MEAQRFPLDFQALRRGDYLTPEQVEDATLTPRHSRLFRPAMLQLRDEIMAYFRSIGQVVTVTTEHDGLRILTHAEQAQHAPTRARKAVEQMMTALAESKAVDVQQLTDEDRLRHERSLLRLGWQNQQLTKAQPPKLTG